MKESAENRRRFRPAVLPTLLTLALMPVLIGLGFWQLGRADYKRELEAAYAGGDAEPVPALRILDAEADRFRPVTASGSYDGERQFLIDNMVRQGRNGFFVITPFRLGNGALLLVNRGWIPQDALRQPVAELEIGEGMRRITGRVGRLPVAGIDLGAPPDGEAAGWPSVRQFPDMTELADALGEATLPWVLLLAPAAGDGYERDWSPGGMPATRHIGYAVQWFALAAALAVIYFVTTLKR